jgi:hypothetical protein
MTTFAVFEIFPDGKEEEVGVITLAPNSREVRNILYKYGMSGYVGDYYGKDYRCAIVLTMFEQIYGFTKGLNGFDLYWDNPHISGTIEWRVPTWKIRKIEDEPIQDG